MKTWAETGIDVKGRNSGEIKTTCPKCSHARKKKNYPCLNVNLDKGIWNCWHCTWSGSLSKGEYSVPARLYRRPDYVAKASGLSAAMLEWFEERGISEDVLRRNQVGLTNTYFPGVEEERPAIAFPYLRGNEVIGVKYRTRDKLFRQESGCERILYGLNDIAELTVWVEGECDKLACEVAGYANCVSVPDGAPAPDSRNYSSKFEFLENCEAEIARIKTHVIAVDGDAPGEKLRDELVRRLGAENCLIVTWPDGAKDANDVLRLYGPVTLQRTIQEAKPLPIVGAFSVSDFTHELAALYSRGSPRGKSTGWKALEPFYTVQPGEMTVLTGIPNSGKSEFLDAVMVNLAELHDWTFGVFSAENWPAEQHIKKLAEKHVRKPFDTGPTPRMTSTEWDQAQTWIGQRFWWIWPETPALETILTIARQLVLRHGVRGIVLDPWNEIEHMRPRDQQETEYVGACLSAIRRFARQNGCHVWVVAHPTKLLKDKNGNYPVPTPYDISGSANWRNKADNCLCVWRELDPAKHSTEVEIHVQKIRNKPTGKLGMAKLEYNRVTGRYSDPKMSADDYEAQRYGEAN